MTKYIAKENLRDPLCLTVTKLPLTVQYDAFMLGDFKIMLDISVLGGNIKGYFEIQGGSTPATLLDFYEDGSIMTREGAIPIAKYGRKPVKLEILYHVNTHLFDIYADGHEMVRDYSADVVTKLYHITVIFDKCVTFTANLTSCGEQAEVKIENVEVCPMGERPVWDKEVIPAETTWFSDESIERNYMKDKVSLHMRSGLVCANGHKKLLPTLPYEEKGELMVPADFFKIAYSIPCEVKGNRIILGDVGEFILEKKEALFRGLSVQLEASPKKIDDTVFLPLRSIVKHGLSYSLSYDTQAIHSGLVLISDQEMVLPEGEAFQRLNDFCFYLRPDPGQWLEDYRQSPLKGVHPRVMATEADFERIRLECETNARKKRWKESVLSYCEDILQEPALKYELRDGVRLMYVSDDFMVWMTNLGLAYQLTKDTRYFYGAWKQIEAVSQFPDWNPAHHIDVGIMALGYAVAYDWFYHIMSPEQRGVMERCVKNNLFWIINEAHKSPDTPYGDPGMDDNHNTFCNAGVIACVIAFMDCYPEIGSTIASNTLRLLERYLKLFAPHGAYFEGPGYAAIGINYCVRLFASMEPTMRTLYCLDKAEAFPLSVDYLMNMQSDVLCFNVADNDPELVTCVGALWIYQHYGIQGKKDYIADFFADCSGWETVLCLLFYSVNEEAGEAPKERLDVYYPGEEIITMRDSFAPGQVFVGIKAGETLCVHSHLDCGSFVFDALGKRWAHDLGKDDYNLEYNWGFYDIFRRRPESHNTLLIDPDETEGFVLGSCARILEYESDPDYVIAKVDMAELFGDKVTFAQRNFCFTDKRRSLVVRDEVSLTGNSTLYWMMYTDAEPRIVDENTVMLSDRKDSSKRVEVAFDSEGGKGEIVIEKPVPFPSSPQIPEQDPNDGFLKLYYRLVAYDKEVAITAKLTPLDAQT